jgi:hypothetical protein
MKSKGHYYIKYAKNDYIKTSQYYLVVIKLLSGSLCYGRAKKKEWTKSMTNKWHRSSEK